MDLITFVYTVQEKTQNYTWKLVVIVSQYNIVEVNFSNAIGKAIRKHVRQYFFEKELSFQEQKNMTNSKWHQSTIIN